MRQTDCARCETLFEPFLLGQVNCDSCEADADAMMEHVIEELCKYNRDLMEREEVRYGY